VVVFVRRAASDAVVVIPTFLYEWYVEVSTFGLSFSESDGWACGRAGEWVVIRPRMWEYFLYLLTMSQRRVARGADSQGKVCRKLGRMLLRSSWWTLKRDR
jgi:hypothetical protein